MNDHTLIARIKNGDPGAFRQLFEQYKRLVYSVCQRICSDRTEAEDAAQDVFVSVYHAIADFRGDAKLSSWIYRIAVNTCLKAERRRKRAYWISLEFLYQDRGKDRPEKAPQTPDEQLEQSERVQLVQEAVRRLPERQRAALVLHRYEGLSYKEVADIMKISLPAVESLLHRAKENLTEILLPLKKYM